MNANLNEIFELVNPANTIGANRYLAHAVGTAEAIVYSALLGKYAYYSEREMTTDGWFFSTVSDLEESTTLSEKQQRKAVDKLVKVGLICTERRGMPAKRFFKISDNLEKLRQIIAEGEKIIEQKFGKKSVKHNDNIDMVSADEYKHEAALQANSYSSAEKSEQEPPKAPNKFRQNAAIPYKTKNINLNNKSSSGDGEISCEDTLASLKKNINYDELCSKRADDRETIDNMLEIMTDVINSKKEKVRVNGDNKPCKRVRDVYLALTRQQFVNALNAVRNNPKPIFNRRGYIITVLYNAGFSCSNQNGSNEVKTNGKTSSFDTNKLRDKVMAQYAHT